MDWALTAEGNGGALVAFALLSDGTYQEVLQSILDKADGENR